MARRPVLLALLLLTFAASLSARVISYAPLTDKQAVPAVQERTNRYYALIEFNFNAPPPILAPPSFFGTGYQLVLYDSVGATEPRVILPKEGSTGYIGGTAVWESPSGTPFILTNSDASIDGDNPTRALRFLFSRDGGATWKAVLTGQGPYAPAFVDRGGPVARGKGAWIRPASAEFPFVVMIARQDGSGVMELYSIAADGTAKKLVTLLPMTSLGGQIVSLARLAGSNREGTELLAVSNVPLAPFSPRLLLHKVKLDGTIEDIVSMPGGDFGLQGWIAPDGTVYAVTEASYAQRTLLTYRNGNQIDSIPLTIDSFAVPTHDFSGAWIVQREAGKPTVLLRHTPGTAPIEMWSDPSGPEVEAIHAAESGERLLIQVHRPRPQADNRLFIDPALAIWEIGDPAPSSYDELFLNEGALKGFVSLDVDRVALGAPFVFDSAMTSNISVPIPISPAPPGGGGGDVTQEWGVVKASLRQRLVIPSVARAEGAFGSFWKTDIVLHNPSDAPLSVALEFVPSGLDRSHAKTATSQLNARETRLIRDVAFSVFNLETASGALFLEPQPGTAITATSRTYSEGGGGTYGMGMPAIDVYAAASPRFAQTFAGALQGTDFRTNLLVTDVSGRGSDARFQASKGEIVGNYVLQVSSPAGGQTQTNDIASWMQFPAAEAGALVFRPATGEALASVVAIDNRTNDPSYFTPDLGAEFTRVIPAIAHAPGANGAQFRSDLFLFNPTSQNTFVTLAAKRWDLPETEAMANISLKPGETRVIRDAFFTLFGKTGVGRLRYQSTSGTRVTSRLYTVDASGATYGLVMPPINAFQSAGEGEALEILGARGGAQFRTNLALVEVNAFANQSGPARFKVEIFGPAGELVDSFTYSVAGAGGVQLGDLFRNRGLGDGPEVSIIRVSVFSGRIAAFASTLDNITNDSMYLSAVLASQEQP